MANHRHHHLSEPATAIQHFGDGSVLRGGSTGTLNVEAQSVRNTIARLGLNDEDTCLKSRERYIKHYCLDMIDFRHLLSEAPFIAKELQRQNLVESIKEIMDYSSL